MSTFLKDAEARVVDAMPSDLFIDALRWLYSMSSKPTVHSIIVESVGALPLSSRSNPKVQESFGANSDIYTTYLQLLKTSLHITPVGRRPNVGLERKAARLLRYGLHVDLPQMPIRVRVEKEDPIEFAVAAFSSRCGPLRGSADTSWISPFLTDVFHMPSPPAFPLSVWFRLIQNATRDGYFLFDRTFSVPFGSCILTSLSQAMRPSTPLDEDAPVTFADAIELHPDFRSQLTDTLLPYFQQCNNIFYNPLVHPNL
ncbi:hypothetical protein CPB85DRAFT_111049 [Mucidula mucida]|nr:hypothetical protein CPB85DRAFT_111049 [Mucidula mucida]